jgi:hypothetical protein
LKKDAVVLETNTFERLTKAESRAVAAAARQYGEFLGLPVVMAGEYDRLKISPGNVDSGSRRSSYL